MTNFNRTLQLLAERLAKQMEDNYDGEDIDSTDIFVAGATHETMVKAIRLEERAKNYFALGRFALAEEAKAQLAELLKKHTEE